MGLHVTKLQRDGHVQVWVARFGRSICALRVELEPHPKGGSVPGGIRGMDLPQFGGPYLLGISSEQLGRLVAQAQRLSRS